ncbi:MAG: Type 1 glutamine amidotransferase-like domain-containing protein [Defluviitaleaceae bacterium]|nr:Type 1 glutamine amidotransferase-like domain-containing protein [Defluviitaleaceae bacterium]
MLGLDNAQKEAIGLDFVLKQLSPATPYGAEKLRQIAPFARGEEDAANRCFDNIEKLMGQNLDGLRGIMVHFKNIRGTLAKCEGLALNEVELFEIKGFLLTFESFLAAYSEVDAQLGLVDMPFAPMAKALDILDPQKARIAPFSIEDGFSPQLAAIRREKNSAEHKPRWEEIVAAEDAEEMRIMAELSAGLRIHLPTFNSNIESLGDLDLAMAKAALAVQHGAVRPKVGKTAVMLRDMTNPMISASLAQSGRVMTPVTLTPDVGVAIITGANMGGKSVAIKTAALNVALCALGIPIFAHEAEIPLFDGIFLVSQDLQDTAHGLSSFGGEVLRLNALADRLRRDFLFVALDEPARATNPAEGAAIVRAAAAWLSQSGSVCLISTHYDGVTAPKAQYYRVSGLTNLPGDINLHAAGRIADFMDYRLIQARANDPIPKDALKICRFLGLDDGLMKKIENEYRMEGDFMKKTHYYFGWFNGTMPKEVGQMLNNDMPDKKSLAIIYTSPAEHKTNDEWLDFTKNKWFEAAGVVFENYHSIDYRVSKEEAHKLLTNASAILLHGGYCDRLHAFIKEYEISDVIKQSRATVIMGASAGGMNMCAKFAYGKYIDDNNREPAEIFNGLGLDNFALQSHAVCTLETLAQQAHTKNYLIPLSEEIDVYVACEESTMRVKDGQLEVMGDVYLISKSKIQKVLNDPSLN